MIKERDLQEAIAECQSVKNPNANTCLKLAAYYTIQDHIAGPGYSYAAERVEEVGYYGDGEFYEAIAGMDPVKAWGVMNELMEALYVLNPKLYKVTMSRLR